MKLRTWTVAAAFGMGLFPGAVLGWGQTPRYQSPYTPTATQPLQTPKLPTPAAITPGGEVVEDVVARVNDQIISRSDVERSEQQLQQEDAQQNVSAEDRAQRQKNMLRDMIDQQLLLSKAKELGLNADAEVIRRLDEIRKQNNLPDMDALEKAARQQGVNFEDFKANIRNQILTQEVVRDEVGRHLQLTHGAEQAYYDAHKQEFARPEQERLSEILIPTPPNATEAEVAQAQQKADALYAKIKAGDDFAALAKANSGGQTAASGGDLGVYKRGALGAKVLEDATFSLKTGETAAPIRTKQGYVLLKVTDHQDAGVPPLKEIEPQIEEAMYSEAMAPALRNYLTKLREEAYIDVKPGFVDSGASPRQTKFVDTAYAAPQSKKQKRQAKAKARLANERARSGRAPGGGLAALPAGTGPVVLPSTVSGATPTAGTTAAVAAAAANGTATAPEAKTVAEETTPTGKSRASQRVSTRGKVKKIKREKIRFGQAPRDTLPAGETEIASGTDTGSGAQSAAGAPSGRGGDVAPGQAMAPTESTTEISTTSDPDPLAPKREVTGKVRFSSRDKEFRAAKAAEKQARAQQKVAATPEGPSVEEAATQKIQSAPLGLNGDTAKKTKKKKVKGEAKERLQDKKPDTGPAPIAPTVNPKLATPAPAAGGNPAPDSNEKNTTLPASTAAPGAPPQGQPLSPTGTPETTPNGTPAPQPQ